MVEGGQMTGGNESEITRAPSAASGRGCSTAVGVVQTGCLLSQESR
jgi:hypothetical protein